MALGLGASKSLQALKTDSGVDPRVKKRSFKEGNRPIKNIKITEEKLC